MNLRQALPLLPALAAAAVFGEGLLNPSFELPGDVLRKESPAARHWTCWGPWMRRETGWAPRHWGPCMIGYHHWRVTEDAPSGFYQDLPDLPGGTGIVFTIYVFKDEASNARTIEMKITPASGGNALASRVYRAEDLPANEWTELHVAGVTRSHSGARLAVSVTPGPDGAPRDGALKFDDAAIEIVSAAAAGAAQNRPLFVSRGPKR